jgi:GNAT superfamily N-acetyltransferase
MGASVELREVTGGADRTCAEILALLPTWFGIPASNQDYIDTAETHPGVIATVDGEDVGITTVKRHSPYAAEVYLMAVKPSHHRQGIGGQMLRRVEERLADEGVEFLQVKTLSAARPDAGYAKTRAFWSACGFRPLEEHPMLWDADNPALQLIKTLSPSAGPDRRGETGAMAHHSRIDKIVIDVASADHDRELAFWAAATGRPLTQSARHPEYHGGDLAGQDIGLLVQRLGDGASRVHVDIHTTDVDAEVARLERLGASRVEQVDRWWVMQDPAGLPFCVVPDDGERLRDENAARWDG